MRFAIAPFTARHARGLRPLSKHSYSPIDLHTFQVRASYSLTCPFSTPSLLTAELAQILSQVRTFSSSVAVQTADPHAHM